MADVTDVPGPPVTVDDEFVLVGTQGERGDPDRGAGATAHHEHVGIGHRHVPPIAPGVPCRGGTGGGPDARGVEGSVTSDPALERRHLRARGRRDRQPGEPEPVDVDRRRAGRSRRVAGDEVEFAAVRQLPVAVGDAVVTDGGRLAARLLIHAVSLDRDRRTSGRAIEAAIRSAFARAREQHVASLALPALGHRRGRLPARRGGADHGRDGPRRAASLARRSRRSSSPCAGPPRMPRSSGRWRRRSRSTSSPRPPSRSTRADPLASRVGRHGEGRRELPARADRRAARRPRRAGRPRDPVPRPDRPGGPLPERQPALSAARQQRDAVLRPDPRAACSAATSSSASAILADDIGIEQLIDRLEEFDEDDTPRRLSRRRPGLRSATRATARRTASASMDR